MEDKKAKDLDGKELGKTELKDAKDAPEQQCSEEAVAGATAGLAQAVSGVVGDTTSSNAGANTMGQHGRDGGTIDGEDNNPEPDVEAVIPPPPEPEVEAAPEIRKL